MIERLHVRHDSPIPRFLQLKSQFEYLIITGELPPGTKLPSIRVLSRSLNISPNTLARAYRELEDAGLVVSNSGSGFFVRSNDLSDHNGHREIRRQVRDLVHRAVQDGLSLDQIAQVFMAEVADMQDVLTRREVVVLCKGAGRLDELTARVQQGLSDIGVQVTGVALEEVLAAPETWLPRLAGAEVVVSLLFDIRVARGLVQSGGVEVVPLLAVPDAAVRERIVHLPPGTRVGIVASSLEFVDGMITAVNDFNPALALAGTADITDRQHLEALLTQVDCVIYGTLSRTVVDDLLPRSVEGIEFLYVPDPVSMQRLRGLLSKEGRT